MASQEKLDRAYMDCAWAMSKLSHATRRQVGAVLVSPEGGIIAEGVNGTPSGFDNNPEFLGRHDFVERGDDGKWFCCNYCGVIQSQWQATNNLDECPGNPVTKRECLHAESNAMAKVACSTNSSKGATLYTTLSPCFECAKKIIQCKIARVVCAEKYRLTDGLELLAKADIPVEFLEQGGNCDDDITNIQDEGRLFDPFENQWR